MTSRHLAAALVLGAVTLATTAPAAIGAPPPKGNYSCAYFTAYGSSYGGTLRVLSKNSYRVNKGKKGRFRSKGSKIEFTTGDYRRTYFGKYRRSNGQQLIYLYDKKSRKERMTCTKSRK